MLGYFLINLKENKCNIYLVNCIDVFGLKWCYYLIRSKYILFDVFLYNM